MSKDVIEAIECWASRPTWFSPHPSDAKELRQAISNLKRIPCKPDETELAEIIYNRVKDLPAMLGTPTDIEASAREFAIKIVKKL